MASEKVLELAKKLLSSGYYKDGGKIHIKKSHEGRFTAKANAAGKGVQEYARQVLAHKENYPASTVKQANFARNAASWHGDGGTLLHRLADGGGVVSLDENDAPQVTVRASVPNNMMDVDDAVNFVKDYYRSAGFRNRLAQAGLKSEDLKIHPKIDIVPDMPVVDSGQIGGYIELGTLPGEVTFPVTNHVITGRPIIRKDIISDNDQIAGAYPGVVAAHEAAHMNPLFNTFGLRVPVNANRVESAYYGNDYSKIPAWWTYLLTPNNPANIHDAELSENYSDLMALRYFLQRNGLFDSNSETSNFTDEDYDKLIDTEGSDALRYLKTHNKDSVVKAINEVASSGIANSKLANLGSFGGKLRKK